jgi:hypothetical protein
MVKPAVDVVVDQPDFVLNHKQAIERYETQAQQLEEAIDRAPAEQREIMRLQALQMRAHAAALKAVDAPTVERYEGEEISCNGKLHRGEVFTFLASFPANQQYLTCPGCGCEVRIPPEYRHVEA